MEISPLITSFINDIRFDDSEMPAKEAESFMFLLASSLFTNEEKSPFLSTLPDSVDELPSTVEVETEDDTSTVTAWFGLEGFIPPGESQQAEFKEESVVQSMDEKNISIQVEETHIAPVQQEESSNRVAIKQEQFFSIKKGKYPVSVPIPDNALPTIGRLNTSTPAVSDSDNLLFLDDSKISWSDKIIQPLAQPPLHSTDMVLKEAEKPFNSVLNSAANVTDSERSIFSGFQDSGIMEPKSASSVLPKILEIQQPVLHKDWGENLNQQILWLGQQKIKTALLRLNPQDLGPVEVSIRMDSSSASVHLTTHNAQVQELIEHSLSRLRELFHQQGLSLAQVNVEQQDTRSGSQRSVITRQFADAVPAPAPELEEMVSEARISYVRQGIVDYFA